jgi:Subtilase family
MPFADRAPIDRRPEPFDPNNLRRSVIAVPLREAIEQELDATKEFAEQHAELLKGHSATVFFLGDRPEEIAAARERVLKRLEKAVQELRELKELRDGIERQSIDLTINDPGNAECAITVGSTHRDMPYMYGVSYFSSKGPTGDGRCKPDLLAPGEKIVSCAAPKCKLVKDEADSKECNCFETSGTSMAAPHVSGAIAAFLSIRKEFIGEPERVKKIFTSTATDLGRDRYFQGSGLVDLMRAIQSV